MAERTADMPLAGSGDRVGGAFRVSSAAVTTIAGAGTEVKMAGTTAAAGDTVGVTVATTNRITWDNRKPGLVHVYAEGLVDIVTGTDAVVVHVFKNGVAITGAALKSEIKTVTAASDLAWTISGCVEMDQGDYLELWVENSDTTENVDCAEAFMSVYG
jgi:hypothetical protein